jgi:polysaccharide biosynthesis protein PelA
MEMRLKLIVNSYTMKAKGTLYFILLWLILFFCLTGATSLFGQTEGKVLKRKILGIYNENEEYGFANSNIQLRAHSILNYYGYYVELMNVNTEAFPDEEKMAAYEAVLIWFTATSINKPDEYLSWIEKQASKGIKIIIIGNTGLEIDNTTGERLSPGLKVRLLSLVGLGYRLVERKASSKVEVVDKDSRMMDFEYKLKEPPGDYEWNVPLNDEVVSWLTIENEDLEDSESTIVATSPQGGYVKNGYALWMEDREPYRQKWIINPFLFFKEILKPQLRPIPDPTTKNGKRVFYTHIDGDAALSVSRAKNGKYCAEVMEAVLIEYPGVKVGVSVVVAEIDPNRKGNQRLVESMRRIFALDNVEIATHTINHPYKWRDPGRTAAYIKEPFDLETELKGSIDYINNNLAPPDKKLKTVYWTGDTTPPAAAFEILKQLGVDGINGGDGALDGRSPSYAHISPFVRHMGDNYWQIHSSQSNENLYTNLWTQDFNGFSNLLKTFKNTDEPYRVAAANAYYHFYSAERVASLKSLHTIYDWVLAQDYEIVFPSEYISMVRGFLNIRIRQLDEDRFEILDRGDLQTLRIDDGVVDKKKSKGVLDVTRHNESYHISLDPQVDIPLVVIDY